MIQGCLKERRGKAVEACYGIGIVTTPIEAPHCSADLSGLPDNGKSESEYDYMNKLRQFGDSCS